MVGATPAPTPTGIVLSRWTKPNPLPLPLRLTQYTLTVSTDGTGSGSVTSDPTGISCGNDCTEDYDYNTPVTLTATPSLGSTFDGWSGACTNTTGDCLVTMDEAKSVAATFTLNQYTLTISTDGTGSGSGHQRPGLGMFNCEGALHRRRMFTTPLLP